MPARVTWPTGVQVVTPTVTARLGTRDATLEQWRALGADPIVVEQPVRSQIGHPAQLTNARAAIHAGLATAPGWVLYAEDDIDVDPALAEAWPTLLAREQPVTLWHRPRFAPAGACDHPADPVRVLRAVAPGSWWGPQAVLMPARLAAAGAAAPDPPHGGIDMVMRQTWRATRRPLHLTVPCLVEHRPLPRLATRSGPRRVDGCCYRGPRTREDPHAHPGP